MDAPPPNPPASDVTRILGELEAGDPSAGNRLLPIVYEELRRLAGQRLRNEPPGLTLQATALVHEAFMRLVGDGTSDHWDGRGHFFGAAAEAMRRILIERARRYQRQKHGGGRQRMPLDDDLAPDAESKSAEELLALDDALKKLEARDPTRAEVVKLRYFGGLTIDQTADALGIASVTVTRHWTCARAWLFSEMTRDSE